MYAYYKSGAKEETIDQTEAFIRENPTHPNIDYAYFNNQFDSGKKNQAIQLLVYCAMLLKNHEYGESDFVSSSSGNIFVRMPILSNTSNEPVVWAESKIFRNSSLIRSGATAIINEALA